MIYLDFQPTRGRQCDDSDFEQWYARKGDSECIMGHKVCRFLVAITTTSTNFLCVRSNGISDVSPMLNVTWGRSIWILWSTMNTVLALMTILNGADNGTIPIGVYSF
jgi:hypothetical protein